MKPENFLRLFAILSAAVIGSACILQTAAVNPTAQFIEVTATPDGSIPGPSSQGPAGQPSPTLTQELTQVLTATFTPSITATFTLAPVTMTAGQALSCVTGPDWKLYEWVAGIAEGETVTLIARAVPEIPDYYVVRKSNGTECWAFSGSSTISGSTSGLPIRETPPPPTVDFVVQNRVQIQLCDVYVRPYGEVAWGADRLTSPNIPIGGEFVLSITAGYYDVLVRDCYASVLYEKLNRAIGSDDTYRILTIAVDVDFFIQNDYGFSVCHIQVQPPGGSWQDLYNHDTEGSFYSGNRKDFTLRAGFYALRVVRCTDAVQPAANLYVHPGMSGIFWS